MRAHPLKARRSKARHLDQIADVSEIIQVDIAKCQVVVLDSAGSRRTIPVKEAFFTRSIPRAGDCLLRYGDGHLSHSSRRAAIAANSDLRRVPGEGERAHEF